MNIITGTIRTELQFSAIVLLIIMMSAGCKPSSKDEQKPAATRSDVTITTPVIKNIKQTASFRGTTKYLQTHTVRSTINGMVKTVDCKIAGTISSGQPLFVIQPLEAAALQKNTLHQQNFQSFRDTIFSHFNGIVRKLNVQTGDFVQSGDPLATCIRANSLHILVEIPVEQSNDISIGSQCSINTPNGREITGHIRARWPSAQSMNQTQPFIVKPDQPLRLSENINVTVHLKTWDLKNAFLIPSRALLGNEQQTSFWVMKMINDSVCVKTTVAKGVETDSMVQVLNHPLSQTDKLVEEGGYGLPDTAKVRVIKK